MSAPAIFGVLVGYLFGSIPFAAIVARLAGVPDLRKAGSGNVGATNVLRTAGLPAGVVAAALDIAKGAASVFVAERVDASAAAIAAAGAASVFGHVFPVWLRFRGGKGVAAACGAFLALAPVATGLAISVFVVVVWVTRYVSLGSIVAAAALPSFAYLTHSPAPTLVAGFAVAALVLLRHQGNMARLIAGTEPRL
jgi:acyl phosphate:glycerol-3-phosphate acyltransferase